MFRDLQQLGILLVLAALLSACGGSTPGQESPANGEQSSDELVEAGSSPTVAPTETPVPPMFPVPINRGLASLDSYRLSYTNDIYDSVPDQRVVTIVIVAQDTESGATYNSIETQSATEDYQIVSTTVQEQYIVGNQVCMLQDGVATINIMSDSARELTSMTSQGMTYEPIIENPEYAGEDTVNGVPVRLYEFEVTSMSATSDAELAHADGNYALAVDGDYLVDYYLEMELRTGPEGDETAEYSESIFDLSLEGINEPQEISFPESCETAFQFAP